MYRGDCRPTVAMLTMYPGKAMRAIRVESRAVEETVSVDPKAEDRTMG